MEIDVVNVLKELKHMETENNVTRKDIVTQDHIPQNNLLPP